MIKVFEKANHYDIEFQEWLRVNFRASKPIGFWEPSTALDPHSPIPSRRHNSNFFLNEWVVLVYEPT